MNVRSHLIRLVIVVLAPLAALAAFLIVQHNGRERDAGQQALLAVARSVSESIDTEVLRSITALQLLARSDALAVEDIVGFRKQLEAVRDIHGRWSNAALLDAQGTRLINLRVPPGEAVRPGPDATWRKALAEMRPQVSDVFVPATSQTPAVYVAVPAEAGGRRYVLAASIEHGLWKEVLARQLPPGWIAAVDDRQGVIFARSERAETFAGKPATPAIRDLYAKGPQGTGRSVNREGLEVYLGFHTSKLTGWHTLVLVPAAMLDAPARTALLTLLGGTLLTLALALLLAFYAARPLSLGIDALRASVTALGRGRRPEAPRSRVDEIDDVGRSIAEASERLASHQARERELQARLAERAQAAEEASRLKDQFLGMLGHELRNPLAAITGANAVLLMTLKGGHRKMPEIIDRQSRHLATLVEGLLDVSRAAAGKLELNAQPADLARIVLEVRESMQASGALDGRVVQVDARPAPVHADVERLAQVVRNLVENALKHTPADGSIRVATREESGKALLAVEDTGRGIEPALLERIFEPFTQAPQELDRPQGGLGLGLAIARQIVQRHGGSIEAFSDGPGHGARFVVRLPARDVREARAARDAAVAPAATPPLRVALIEDLDDVREGLAVMLRADGHEVLEAPDAELGLELLRRMPVDVAFVDIGLPGASGHEVARRVRAMGLAVRLAALTGYGQAHDRERAREAGFDDFLVKPCTQEQIRAVLAARSADQSRAASG